MLLEGVVVAVIVIAITFTLLQIFTENLIHFRLFSSCRLACYIPAPLTQQTTHSLTHIQPHILKPTIACIVKLPDVVVVVAAVASVLLLRMLSLF